MYCIKCGREVSDGELFCSACSNTGGETKQQIPETRQLEKKPEMTPVRNMPQKKPEPKKKKTNMLLIPLIALCLITIVSLVAVVYFYNTMNVTKNNYRVKEANLTAQLDELENLQEMMAATQLELADAEATIQSQEETIAELQEQITLLEGSASQEIYDATSAQQTIDRLTEEKTELSTKLTDLEEEHDTLTQDMEALQETLDQTEQDLASREEELEALNEDLEKAEEKAEFMDNYVVFVNDDDTNYYHNYDCAKFTKSNFWAYSRKLAQNYGYEACPHCGG